MTILFRALFVLSIATALDAVAGSTVYPTGTYPLDVQNVQSALDGGGTVLLKATDAAGIPTAFNSGLPTLRAGGWNSTWTPSSLANEPVPPKRSSKAGGIRWKASASLGPLRFGTSSS